jgi:hypothetical protein
MIREAFEKWWDSDTYKVNNDYLEDTPIYWACIAWQAAQENQAETIAQLEVDSKRLKRALKMGGELYRHDIEQLLLDNARLQAKLDTILITAEDLANEVRMSQPQRDVMTGFVAGVKEAIGVNVIDEQLGETK